MPSLFQKDLGGERKFHSNRLMAYPALSIACIKGCLSKSAIHRIKKKKKKQQKTKKTKTFSTGSFRLCLHSFSSPKCLRQLTSHWASIHDSNVCLRSAKNFVFKCFTVIYPLFSSSWRVSRSYKLEIQQHKPILDRCIWCDL